jgi:hypothetical protein
MASDEHVATALRAFADDRTSTLLVNGELLCL